MAVAATDLIVVGAGLAGLAAACRAAEAGLRVVVLERGEDEDYPCNSRFAGGVFHVAFHDARSAPDALSRHVERATGGFARAELNELVSTGAGRALDWLVTRGATLAPVSDVAWQSNVLVPSSIRETGLAWSGKGTDRILRVLAAYLREAGSELWLGHEAIELLRDDSAVVGVRARSNGTIHDLRAAAIVLADGGFQADPDSVRSYISPSPEKLRLRGAPTGSGSGLRLAEAAGAALVSLSTFYGHLLSRDALDNDALWPHPTIDAVAQAGILVADDGRRFADEGLGGIYLTNAVARLDDPLSAIAFCDSAVWEGPAADPSLPAPNPLVSRNGGTVLVRDTVDELAPAAGVDASGLRETLETYNAAVAASRGERLAPPRSGAPEPLVRPPFYALPVCAGITFTTGGVLIDRFGRALDDAERPVPGLYAVGATSGGLEGGPKAGYVGGLIKALVTGLAAGEHAAAKAAAA